MREIEEWNNQILQSIPYSPWYHALPPIILSVFIDLHNYLLKLAPYHHIHPRRLSISRTISLQMFVSISRSPFGANAHTTFSTIFSSVPLDIYIYHSVWYSFHLQFILISLSAIQKPFLQHLPSGTTVCPHHHNVPGLTSIPPCLLHTPNIHPPFASC